MFWLLLGCAAQARGDRVDELANWCSSVSFLGHVDALPELPLPPQSDGRQWVIEADEVALVMPHVARESSCGGPRTPCTTEALADELGSGLYRTVGLAAPPETPTGRWAPVVQHLMGQEGATLRILAHSTRPPKLGRNLYAAPLDEQQGELEEVYAEALVEAGCPAPTEATCEAADLRRWFQSCEDPEAAQGALTWRVTQERPGTFVDISLDPQGTPLTLAADLPWQDAVTELSTVDGAVALTVEPERFTPAPLPGAYDAVYTTAWREVCETLSPMPPGLRSLPGPPTRIEVPVVLPQDVASIPVVEEPLYVAVLPGTSGALLAQVVQRPGVVLVGAADHAMPPFPDPAYVGGITDLDDGRELARELVKTTLEACPEGGYAIGRLFEDDCGRVASALDDLAVTCGAETGNRFASVVGAGLPKAVTAMRVDAVGALPDDPTPSQVLDALTLTAVTPPVASKTKASWEDGPPEWGAKVLMDAIHAGEPPQGEIQVRGRAESVDGPHAVFEGGLSVRQTRVDDWFYSHLQPGDVGWAIGTWDGEHLQASYVDWMQPSPPPWLLPPEPEPEPLPTGKRQTSLVADVALPLALGNPVPMAALVVPTHGLAPPTCELIADPVAIKDYVKQRDAGALAWQVILVTSDRLVVAGVELDLTNGQVPDEYLLGDLVTPVFEELTWMRELNQPCRDTVPVVLFADPSVPEQTLKQLKYTAGQAGITMDRAVQPTGKKLGVTDTLYVVRD